MKKSTYIYFLILFFCFSITSFGQCPADSSIKFSCFEGLPSSNQGSYLRLPSSHTYEVLERVGDAYTNPGIISNFRARNDFAPYIGKNNNSRHGYLGLNHEYSAPLASDVSVMEIDYDSLYRKWEVTTSQPIDFTAVGPIYGPCSGGITPWGTFISSGESYGPGDANGDGYEDMGWQMEIDPVTKSLVDVQWAMGRFGHENVVFLNDTVAFQGEDRPFGFLSKFIADTANDLSSGKLYVFRLDSAIGLATTGKWIQIPNTTQAERNNTVTYATDSMATAFHRIEDVDISPVNGKIYVTSTTDGRIYRFDDNQDGTVSNFEIYVDNSTYNIDTESGIQSGVTCCVGADNLLFDNEGNLYITQDAQQYQVWMVDKDHTPANPNIRVFAQTPSGSEPTGMTFSPDNRFAFLSIQHPASAAVQSDVFGNASANNQAFTIVIARKEFLGDSLNPEIQVSVNGTIYNNGDTLNIGLVEADSTEVIKVVISNTGFDNLVVTDEFLTGSNVSNFQLINSNERFLPYLVSDTLEVGFTPTSLTSFSSNLNLITNDTNERLFNLLLIGSSEDAEVEFLDTNAAQISDSLYFNTVSQVAIDSIEVMIVNTGNQLLVIDSIILTGTGGAYFMNSALDQDSVQVGNTASIVIYYFGLNAGIDTAQLEIVNNSWNAPNQVFYLFGNHSSPILTIKHENILVSNFDTLSFDSVFVDSSKTISFNILNSGNIDLVVDSIWETLDVLQFSHSVIGAMTILPQDSLLLQVELSPNSVGAKQLLLSIASNDVTNAIANIYFDGFGLLYITGAEEHKTTGNLLVEVKLLDNLLSVTNNEQQELKLHLYNSLGQIVLVGDVGGNSQTVFDLQSLNSCSYFLIAVGQGEAIHSVKFIYTK